MLKVNLLTVNGFFFWNHGFRKPETVLPVNSFLTDYLCSLAFGSMMSVFRIKVCFAFFSKTTRRICAIFFQDLRENTCSLQPALKSTALGLLLA